MRAASSGNVALWLIAAIHVLLAALLIATLVSVSPASAADAQVRALREAAQGLPRYHPGLPTPLPAACA